MAAQGSSRKHDEICKATTNAINAMGVARVWGNNTGALKSENRFVKFGLAGSADIIGITSDGHFIGLECKTGSARQTRKQISFEHMVKLLGGRYYIFRTVEEAVGIVQALGLERIDFSQLLT